MDDEKGKTVIMGGTLILSLSLGVAELTFVQEGDFWVKLLHGLRVKGGEHIVLGVMIGPPKNFTEPSCYQWKKTERKIVFGFRVPISYEYSSSSQFMLFFLFIYCCFA